MGGRARVLVIDHEIHIGTLLQRMLHREYTVTVVTSGREALDRITRGEEFDLVLCDVMMPQMTGMAFYEQLAAVAPELVERVLFMTGGAFADAAEVFLQQPFIQKIEKPFPPLPELRAVVREHIRRLGSCT